MIRANVGHAAFARLRPPAPAISREAGDRFRTEESAAEALRTGAGRSALPTGRENYLVSLRNLMRWGRSASLPRRFLRSASYSE